MHWPLLAALSSYLVLSTSFIFCSRSILLLRSLSSSCRRESTLVSSRSFLSSSSGKHSRGTHWRSESHISHLEHRQQHRVLLLRKHALDFPYASPACLCPHLLA
ncbi:hypothetical protein EYF80_019340 [Liparis tanakae]|uniref:Uncharacterized protein n=1 Tax=Liparis tanakae TaxID=230148 RepID=A0A4Z2HZS0_9TELE|nr:hypothetical protein EYF80_019340 [Liparis tanakae]